MIIKSSFWNEASGALGGLVAGRRVAKAVQTSWLPVNGAAAAKGGRLKTVIWVVSDGAMNCWSLLKTWTEPALLSITTTRTVQGTGGKALPNSDVTSISEPPTLLMVRVVLGCLITTLEMLQSFGAGGILW